MSIAKQTLEALSQATSELSIACKGYREDAESKAKQVRELKFLRIKYDKLCLLSRELCELLDNRDAFHAILLENDALDYEKFKDNRFKTEKLTELEQTETMIEDLMDKIRS